ncbi:hypothetical protein [Leucothrix arctica]|uniref:Uncharacterized protein n=1 Tax=Leucothrix arctica TaxID=1481894 RepID=A0A317CFU2_9GAMM|nr:hypothetical protein [Leucothrix arctica]PWQ97464.1 hypothetical protein DKT75_05930 [Leucothrix arctica]
MNAIKQLLIQPFMTWSLSSLLVCWIVGIGFLLDQQQHLNLSSLCYAYSLASVCGVLAVVIYNLLRTECWFRITMILVIAAVAWRVSFFPIIVLAGYMTTLTENVFFMFSIKSLIYPALLLNVMLLHALVMVVAIAVVQGSRSRLKRYLLILVALPFGLLAGIVSFVNDNDWEVLPFSLAGEQSVTAEVSLPHSNPYAPLLAQDGYNWRQITLLYAASATYSLIPSDGRWTQSVKGTLEQDLRGVEAFESRYFTLSHFNAFWLAGSVNCYA